MRCGHCGKDYPDEYNYCPFCAEPKPKPEPTEECTKEDYNERAILKGLPIVIAAIVVGGLVGRLLTILWFGRDVSPVWSSPFILLFAAFAIWGVARYYGNKRRRAILTQFYADQTSICPKCGCHSISLGRKGYDWNKGFWYSVFDVPGGRYLAGMDGRRITCYCDNCNYRWESDKVWIK